MNKKKHGKTGLVFNVLFLFTERFPYLDLATLVGKVLLGDMETTGLLLLGSEDVALLQEHKPELVKVIKGLDSELGCSPCAAYFQTNEPIQLEKGPFLPFVVIASNAFQGG